jgi:hypothetical protein
MDSKKQDILPKINILKKRQKYQIYKERQKEYQKWPKN